MIQSKWCTVTATVCGVLAVASPAAAECAWVLWSQVHDPRPGAWQLQTAYPSVGACAKALDQREKEGYLFMPAPSFAPVWVSLKDVKFTVQRPGWRCETRARS